MNEKTMKLNQIVKAIGFIEHAHTVKNTFKEMEPVWDSLKVDGVEVIVKQHMTRVKAQCVQLYARKLMQYVMSIMNFDMFPIAIEDVRIGNWRVDSIIIQIASNEVKSHEHLYQLLMTNIFGIPTVMFDFIQSDFGMEKLEEYLSKTYSPVLISLPDSQKAELTEFESLLDVL